MITQLTGAALYQRHTMRIMHLEPMRVLLRSMTINSLFVGASLVILSFLNNNLTLLLIGGLVIPLGSVFFRAQLEQWLFQHKLKRSAAALALVYLTTIYFATLVIGHPLIIPLVIIEALLPLLLGVLYDLQRSAMFLIAATGLYLLTIITLILPLPTKLPVTDGAWFLLLINVLFLGMGRILATYRAVQVVFIDQAAESQRRLDMLKVLEADLKLRNAQLEQAAKISEQANNAKTQFLQHMSHELRSPLNTVIGLSEIIAEDFNAFPQEMIQEQASQIYKAGQHLLAVISDVLDIAKIESGTFQVYYEEIDPLLIINGLQPMIVGLQARWPDIHFKMETPESLPLILAEDRRVRQILINLLDNAFKYTRRGDVTLRASCDDEGIIVTVQDTGIGISPENFVRIFEPFEQAAGQLAIGTGLGLAITRHLVLEHAGMLRVESEVGHGSIFSMFLPRADIEFPEKGKGMILVVDYDRNIHTVIKHLLNRAGYEVVAVTAPDEARDAMQFHAIDGVIMDIQLPTDDIGWQFVQELRGISSQPLIVYAPNRHRKRAEKEGVPFIEKPSRPFALIKMVNAAMHAEPSERGG